MERNNQPEISIECSGEDESSQLVILGNGNDDPAEMSSFIDYDANIFATGGVPSANRCASPPSCLPASTPILFSTNQSEIKDSGISSIGPLTGGSDQFISATNPLMIHRKRSYEQTNKSSKGQWRPPTPRRSSMPWTMK